MYFFTAIGSEDIISIVHMYLAFFRFQLLDSRNVPTVLVQLIQKILICKVLNSCTKRKLDEQGSRATQFRVPPGSPMVWVPRLLPGRAHRSYACTVVYYAMINGQVHNTSYRSRY